jgi:hypothetical protein
VYPGKTNQMKTTILRSDWNSFQSLYFDEGVNYTAERLLGGDVRKLAQLELGGF